MCEGGSLVDTSAMNASMVSPPLGIPMVYLVDDEPVVRDALAWLLRSRRLLSEGFGNAEDFEAWLDKRDLARGWPDAPSCLLLDVRMPGTSGLVLFERLVARGLTAALPVIFLMGHGDVPTAVATVKRGAFDFVESPFLTTPWSTAWNRPWRPVARPSCGVANNRPWRVRWPT
jgi:FixJ family two-component response regulator